MDTVSVQQYPVLAPGQGPQGAEGSAYRYVLPRLPDGFVSRPRVTRLLERGGSSRLTLVSAPAGTGKTTAVTEWVRHGRTPGPAVWVSLDDVRAVGASLWDTVLHALRLSPVLRERLSGWDATTSSPRFLASITAVLLDLSQPLVLVLDRVEDLTRDDAADLDLVSRHSGGNLRLVLLSRADPPFPLHRYRLNDDLVEVRMADLAFTHKEADALLASRGVHLSRGAADNLMRRTGGWAAGLVLATMALGTEPDAEEALAQLCGDGGIISEYLMAEVLDRHTPAARELLLRSSVVDVLEPGLAEAVAGPNASRSLRFLEHGNAFLEVLPHSGGRMRFQPLFRELLRTQLAFERPDEPADLHLRAARWLAADGQLDAAVAHACRGGRPDLAATWLLGLTGLGRLLLAAPTSGLWQTVEEDVLPALARASVRGRGADRPSSPAIELLRAALATSQGRLDAAEAHLSSARRHLESSPDPELSRAAAILTADVVTRRDTAHAALAAARSMTLLLRTRDADRPLLAAAAMATAAGHLGLGDLTAAREAYSSAEELVAEEADDALTEGLRCRGMAGRALIAAWTGHLRTARDLGEQLRARCIEGSGGSAELRAALLCLAWVQVEAMDLDHPSQNLRLLTRCRLPAAAAERSMHAVMTGLVRARTAHVAGQSQRARDALRLAEDQVRDGPRWLVDRLSAERHWLRLAPGRAVAPSGQDNDITASVERRILEAAAGLELGQHATARRALERALRTASQEEMRRPFAVAGAAVQGVLRSEILPAARAWLSVPTTAAAPGPDTAADRWDADGHQAVPPVLWAPLTDKEREVLSLLAQLLSTEEIAAAMFVSVNTVRTHVRSILRKLGASRRNDAVRRAQKLQLL